MTRELPATEILLQPWPGRADGVVCWADPPIGWELPLIEVPPGPLGPQEDWIEDYRVCTPADLLVESNGPRRYAEVVTTTETEGVTL